MEMIIMRATGSLLFFRFAGIALMVLGSVHLLGTLILVFGEQMRGMGGPGIGANWWFMVLQILIPPITIFSVGAILSVLVEIALRLGQHTKDSQSRPALDSFTAD